MRVEKGTWKQGLLSFLFVLDYDYDMTSYFRSLLSWLSCYNRLYPEIVYYNKPLFC